MTGSQLFYLGFLLTACGAAFWRGAWPERGAAVAVLLASFASPVVEADVFASPEYGILLIDCMLLLCLGSIGLVADRFWPLWATGFHLVGTIIHLARAADPSVWPSAYATGQVFWSYPVLAALAVGSFVEAPIRR